MSSQRHCLVIDYIPHIVHFIPVTHIFFNYKFVPLPLPHLFLSSSHPLGIGFILHLILNINQSTSICLKICAFWSILINISLFLLSSAAATKSLQLCPTLCDPIDGSPPGSAVPRVLQARILKWVAISFSSAWKWKVKVKSLSRVRLFVTPWTAAYQAPLPMGFSRQEYWSGSVTISSTYFLNYSYKWDYVILVFAYLAYFT